MSTRPPDGDPPQAQIEWYPETRQAVNDAEKHANEKWRRNFPTPQATFW